MTMNINKQFYIAKIPLVIDEDGHTFRVAARDIVALTEKQYQDVSAYVIPFQVIVSNDDESKDEKKKPTSTKSGHVKVK